MKHILGLGPQHISQTASHARTEIQAEWPKNDGHAAGHVLTAMLTDTFHHRERTAVSDGKTFAAPASDKELARRRAVEHGVSRKHGPAPGSSKPGGDSDGRSEERRGGEGGE